MIMQMSPVENAGLLVKDITGGDHMDVVGTYGKTIGGVLALGLVALGAGKLLKKQFIEDVNSQSEKFKNVIRAHNVEVQAHVEKAKAEEREAVEEEILIKGEVIGQKEMPDVKPEPAKQAPAATTATASTTTTTTASKPANTSNSSHSGGSNANNKNGSNGSSSSGSKNGTTGSSNGKPTPAPAKK